MAKKKVDKRDRDGVETRASSAAAGEEPGAGPPAKIKRKEYERQMRILHGELVAMQEWVRDSGAKRARLNIISHLLGQVPYKPPAHRDIKLPKRQQPAGYVPPELPLRRIPTPF